MRKWHSLFARSNDARITADIKSFFQISAMFFFASFEQLIRVSSQKIACALHEAFQVLLVKVSRSMVNLSVSHTYKPLIAALRRRKHNHVNSWLII